MLLNQGAQGVAQTQTGAISSTKVAQSIVGSNQIIFTLKADADGGTDVFIKPASWRPTTDRKGITFEGKHFKSWDEFWAYFNAFATQVVSMKMITDNTENFDGELIITSKAPTGQSKEITKDLSELKVSSNTPGGFENNIQISNWPIFLDPGMDLQISEIKPNSYIKFVMNIWGQSKAFELSEIEINKI